MWLKNNSSFFNHIKILCILISLCTCHILFQYYGILLTQLQTVLINDLSTSYYLSSLKNCDSTPIFIDYHHETSARNSSYSYISDDTFRAFSDYIFDETRQDNLSLVKSDDIVFVHTNLLDIFFSAPSRYGKQLLNPKILH